MKKFEMLALLLIVLGGFLVRLYRFDNPIADWHAWRQADTSAVSRNFIKYGFDLLHPKFDDLSKIPSGLENPEGYRFVEFPIYNLFQAGFYTLFDYFSLEQWGRLVSIFSSLLSVIFLYLLVRKHIGIIEAQFCSFFFAFLPFSIYYSRTILPDEMMVMASLGSIYFFDRWISQRSNIKDQISKIQLKNQILFTLSVTFTALALLLKPFALFFTLPMIYLAYQRFGLKFIGKWQFWLFLILSISPLLLWRLWMQQYPEGIPANDWLFNANNIRFKGAFFYWIFGERLSKLILGYLGVAFFVTGLFRKSNDHGYLFSLSFLLSSVLYLFVIAAGNVQHDYYQILIIPTVSLFLARGASFFLSLNDSANRFVSTLVVSVLIVGMFAFSWYYIRDYFNVNNSAMVEAGKKADALLPKDARVITPYKGDTSFLYQTNRAGWPVIDRPIEEMIQMGAQYLVIENPTKNDFEGFGKKYTTIASSPSYLILKLQ